MARDLDEKYKDEGLQPQYSIYAVALAVNDITPSKSLPQTRTGGDEAG